jgi:tetratricopeptide (TPR) repeat protein
MKYDRLGFPIPPEFDLPAGVNDDFPSGRRAAIGDAAEGSLASGRADTGSLRSRPAPGSSRGKRMVVMTVLLGAVVPGVVIPAAWPMMREAVVQWSLEQAVGCEAHGNLAGAISELGRAIRWSDGDATTECRLLCWRATLRIENRDAAGAVADADRAIEVAPTSIQPRRVRALALVVLDQPEAALADAHAAVDMAGRGDPEALNHRAYVRALVRRELPEALADIDAALAGTDQGAAEFLDTRGYILHLLGRHQEAIDLLNVAIDKTQRRRRQLAMLSGRADPDELAHRLRSIDQGLAVMHHHRGLACEAVGLEHQARQDLEIALAKGFAPDRGIF